MERVVLILLIGVVLLIAGCGGIHDTFFNQNTILPLAGAGILYAGGFDEKISDWAVKHHPIYGSKDRAIDIRSYFKDALGVETYVTAIAAPDKVVGIGVAIGARKATRISTNVLKDAVGRARPDGSNDTSFPSSCTSAAFSSATISNRNINRIDALSGDSRKGLRFVNLLLASGVGWSRVESGSHYPSDVLAGAALGHFLSAFIDDTFLGLEESRFSIVPAEGGAMARVTIRY